MGKDLEDQVRDGQQSYGVLQNSIYVFKDQSGEERKIRNYTEEGAWIELSRNMATTVDEMRRMGIKLIERRNGYVEPSPKDTCLMSKCGHPRSAHADGACAKCDCKGFRE